MSGTVIPLNTVPNDPTLSDLLNLLKKEIFLDMNCCHVGTVQSFNSTNQTVYATVNYQKTYFQLNSTTGTYQPVLVAYPTAVNCPLVVLRGGTVSLTFPIAQGDECLLLFNDRDISNWFSNGSTTQGNATGQLHAFSDAIALVGVKSTPKALSAYDTVRALLTNGNVALGINPSSNKVRIANTSAGTLNSILQNVLTQVQAIGNAVAVPGAPVAPAAATQIATYATQLGSLLE